MRAHGHIYKNRLQLVLKKNHISFLLKRHYIIYSSHNYKNRSIQLQKQNKKHLYARLRINHKLRTMRETKHRKKKSKRSKTTAVIANKKQQIV